jgi:hypothetical protein
MDNAENDCNNVFVSFINRVVEERLIDGGSLLASSDGVKNQIRSVTTVVTTTVVNSVQSNNTKNWPCSVEVL